MVIGPKEVYKAVIEANNPQKLNAFCYTPNKVTKDYTKLHPDGKGP